MEREECRWNNARTFSVAVFQCVAIAGLFLVAFVVAPGGRKEKTFKCLSFESLSEECDERENLFFVFFLFFLPAEIEDGDDDNDDDDDDTGDNSAGNDPDL